jgi:hypothetical protein
MSTLMGNKLRFIFRSNDVLFGQQKYMFGPKIYFIYTCTMYLLQRINKNIYKCTRKGITVIGMTVLALKQLLASFRKSYRAYIFVAQITRRLT